MKSSSRPTGTKPCKKQYGGQVFLSLIKHLFGLVHSLEDRCIVKFQHILTLSVTAKNRRLIL